MGRKAKDGDKGLGTGTQDNDPQLEAPDSAVQARSAGGPAIDGVTYTPLFRAQHESRYRRQTLIREYEQAYNCNLVVAIDQIMPESVTYFAELLHGLDKARDLHLMLCSPGGDGETAIRLARMAQAASARFVVLVPESAKSAATILALGAHEIVMGPTSDLGPIDPQVFLPRRGYVSAKDLIAAVDRAFADIEKRPATFPLHAAMLGGIDATSVQFARSALSRTKDLALQAVSSNPDRKELDVKSMCKSITTPLINAPHSHGALIGPEEAKVAGLPVKELDPTSEQWRRIWALWTQYFSLAPIDLLRAYEGARASQVDKLSSDD